MMPRIGTALLHSHSIRSCVGQRPAQAQPELDDTSTQPFATTVRPEGNTLEALAADDEPNEDAGESIAEQDSPETPSAVPDTVGILLNGCGIGSVGQTEHH